jgi:hypothetical protein
MTYELWDTRGATIVGSFEQERDALRVVASGIELHGPTDTDTLVLVVEDDHDDTHLISEGKDLAARAHRETMKQRVAD